MEARIVTASGWQFAAIKAGKFRRMQSAGMLSKLLNPSTLGPNIRDLARVVQGVGGALRILRRFKPEVVFLKGGFVCLPVGIAARLLHIPYVIHESDVSPGLANRILGKWAYRIAVGFPVKHYHDFDKSRLMYVGNPVRPDILKAHRLEGLAMFKLQDGLPVILITGGSQGATQINDVVLEALSGLLPHYQIIHQTGDRDLERIRFELGRRSDITHLERYHPYAFLMKEMAPALAVADLVIGRAGVGTINDSAALGKPTVLIPNYEMASHQLENARLLARQGAVRVLNGTTLTPAKLVGEVKRILDDPAEQALLSKGIRELGRPQAAHDLAVLLEATVRKFHGAGESAAGEDEA